MKKAWIYVALTSVFELLWVYGLLTADAWWHWGLLALIVIVDFMLLARACEGLPAGTVYAVFAAAGTIGTSAMDIFIFDGRLGVGKMLFMLLLVAGVIGLKLADGRTASDSDREAGNQTAGKQTAGKQVAREG